MTCTVPAVRASRPASSASALRCLRLLAVSVGLLLGLLGGVVLAPAALAAKQPDLPPVFGVRPSKANKVDLRPNLTYRDVKPGSTIKDYVAVVNVSTKPVVLRVYASDAFTSTDGGYDLLTRQSKQKDVGAWTSLIRDTVRVPARSTFITPITIKVPRNAEPGDHAGGIVASLQTVGSDEEGGQVQLEKRAGTRIYLRVRGKLSPRLELAGLAAGYTASNPIAPTGQGRVTYTVRNTGNVRLQGKQTVRISNIFGGSTVAKDLVDLPEMLPGAEATFTAPVDKVLPAFLLTGEVTLDPQSVKGNVDPASQQVSAKKTFWAVYWPLVVALLLLAGYLGLRFYRRRNAAPGARRGPGSAGGPGADPSVPPTAPVAQDQPTQSAPPAPPAAPVAPVPAGPAAAPTSAPTPASELTPEPVPGAGPAAQPSAPEDWQPTERRASVWPRPLLTALAAVAALSGLFWAAAPAQAAGKDLGSLTFVSAGGAAADITPMWAVPSAGCPKESSHYVGYITGKGFPGKETVVISNGDATFSSTKPFGVPLQDSLYGIAKAAGVKLEGKYTITMECIGLFPSDVYGYFDGVISFAKEKSKKGFLPLTAPQPKNPPENGIPQAVLAEAYPEVKKAMEAAETPAGEPGPGASNSAARPGASDAAAGATAGQTQAVAGSTAAASGSGVTPYVVVVIGLLALGLLTFLATRMPRRTAKPAGAGPAVAWPDEQPVAAEEPVAAPEEAEQPVAVPEPERVVAQRPVVAPEEPMVVPEEPVVPKEPAAEKKPVVAEWSSVE